MSQYFEIHADNPQRRLIQQAAEILRGGGVIVYPTDSSYALGCQIGDKDAADRLRSIRQLDNKHDMTLVCSDLSEISHYAKVDNTHYRLLKNLTPGPYTFILKATHEVPRRLQHPKRKAIGIRVPDNQICHDLLAELGEPIISTTLIMPNDDMPLTDPYEMRELLEHQVDLVIDGGHCGLEPTTVLDLTQDPATVRREGKGEVPW